MSLLAAIAFLTILPLPGGSEPRHLVGSTRWFPLVGLAMGIILAGLDWLLGMVLAQPARDALIVVAGIALSGALHLDGLMDTCDGALASATPKRRLQIMRDSHVGSFGVAGAGLVLLGKYAALASLAETPRWAALVVMAVLGRWGMSLTVAAFPAARSEGLGWLVKKGAARTDLLLAGGLAVLVCWLSFHLAGILLFAGVTTLVWLVGRALVNRLTGLTGDAYGALDEIGEVAALALAPLCVTAVSRSTI